MKVHGFDHVVLPVADVDRSQRWYCDVLQAEVIRRTGEDPRDVRAGRELQSWIRAGGAVVVLAAGRPLHRPEDVHFFHYALHCDFADYDAWIGHMRRCGVEPLGPFGHGGSNALSVYFDDPDAYRWELKFVLDDFETAKAEALRRGGRLGNPTLSYDWA